MKIKKSVKVKDEGKLNKMPKLVTDNNVNRIESKNKKVIEDKIKQ